MANCVEFEGDQCLKCFNMFYVKDNTCQEVDPLCKTFDSSNGQCTTCYSLFTLRGGECVFV